MFVMQSIIFVNFMYAKHGRLVHARILLMLVVGELVLKLLASSLQDIYPHSATVASAPGPLLFLVLRGPGTRKYVMLRHFGPAWVCPWRRLLSP